MQKYQSDWITGTEAGKKRNGAIFEFEIIPRQICILLRVGWPFPLILITQFYCRSKGSLWTLTESILIICIILSIRRCVDQLRCFRCPMECHSPIILLTDLLSGHRCESELFLAHSGTEISPLIVQHTWVTHMAQCCLACLNHVVARNGYALTADLTLATGAALTVELATGCALNLVLNQE